MAQGQAVSAYTVYAVNEIALWEANRTRFTMQIPANEPRTFRVRTSASKSYRVKKVSQSVGKSGFRITVNGSSEYRKALRELDRLSRYPGGWNGPRSAAADLKSFRLAGVFLTLIEALRSDLLVEVSINAVGTAVLDLKGKSLAASLEFLGNGEIAANIDNPAGAFDLDLQDFTGDKIPADLMHFLA
jgi:hypothetical protein